MSYEDLEYHLLGTRRNIADVCKDLGMALDMEDLHNLMAIQCTHCSTWVKSFNVIEDLDSNPICKYCADLIGL